MKNAQAPLLKRLFIETHGCQMNVYDSERMRDVLAPLGYAPVDALDDADLVERHAELCRRPAQLREQQRPSLGVERRRRLPDRTG